MVSAQGTGCVSRARPAEIHYSNVWVGIDIGSTTVKTVAIDQDSREVVSWRYVRHNACQADTVYQLLESLQRKFKGATFTIAACGSGAEPIVEKIGGRFVQEVIATSIALREFYPRVRTAIELGGQDAKIMVFSRDATTGHTVLSDMRMNGSCAGGTGAFIDQMAVLLGIKVEDFNALASRGAKVHAISGRCGVFAKSDILPLINNGIPKEDIALSVFHAVASQTICSLAQGMEIIAPVAFMGGPLSFNPVLVQAYREKLNIPPDKTFLPEHPLIIAAIGAAYSLQEVNEKSVAFRGAGALRVASSHGTPEKNGPKHAFFSNLAEQADFSVRHEIPPFTPFFGAPKTVLEVFAGIDAGSTTLKVVFIDRSGAVVNKWYGNNSGDTIGTARSALLSLGRQYAEKGVTLRIAGVGTTGYGEHLCAQALGADHHTVETVAHAAAALHLFPDATFLLDIGGQDMKAMKIENGVIQEVYLNEACSSGCGSFIETTARSLGVPVERIAETAFSSPRPASLGSRCTVFMLSSVTTEQKNGKSMQDIIAGLCRSVIENVFSKVLRVSDVKHLGPRIIVQGGTFKNDAVLRAFEQHVGRPVHRPIHCGEMGALGIALLTRKAMTVGDGAAKQTAFLGLEALERMGPPRTSSSTCTQCGNRCNRDIVSFGNGVAFCTGNRCEKGNLSSSAGPHIAGGTVSAAAVKKQTRPLTAIKEELLLSDAGGSTAVLPPNGITMGLPLVFEFWNSLPFWKSLFRSLGFTVEVSGKSTAQTAQTGSRFAASDSICFPAKLMHGHCEALLARKVDRIFAPALKAAAGPHGGTAVNMCPVIQGLPIMVRHLNTPADRFAVAVDSPVFAWHSRRLRNGQIARYFRETFGIAPRHTARAIARADDAMRAFRERLTAEFNARLAEIERSAGFGVMLLGRPYHADSFVNHRIPEIFASLGIPTLTADTVPHGRDIDTLLLRPEKYNPFHTELYGAALLAARHPRLEAVQLVSFGCGHDAIITDEIRRLMASVGSKRPLVLKIDDGECRSALTIRIRSFAETALQRRSG